MEYGIFDFKCECGNGTFTIEYGMRITRIEPEFVKAYRIKDVSSMNLEPSVFRCSACLTSYRKTVVDGYLGLVKVEQREDAISNG